MGNFSTLIIVIFDYSFKWLQSSLSRLNVDVKIISTGVFLHFQSSFVVVVINGEAYRICSISDVILIFVSHFAY